MANPQLQVKVRADTTEADANLKKLQGRGESASASIAKGFIAAQAAIAIATKAAQSMGNTLRFIADVTRTQIKAETELAAALGATGQATDENIRAIKEHASAMQEQTNVGDDVSLSIAAQISQLTGLSADALPKAITATLQYAQVTNKDSKTAVLDITKALQGNVQTMARYGITIDATGTQQETLNAIIDTTSAGMDVLRASTETVEGRWEAMKNLTGDLSEEIGRLFFENEQLSMALGGVNDAMRLLIERLAVWMENNPELVEQISSGLGLAVIKLAQGINEVARVITMATTGWAVFGKTAAAVKNLLEGNALAARNLFIEAANLQAQGLGLVSVFDETAGVLANTESALADLVGKSRDAPNVFAAAANALGGTGKEGSVAAAAKSAREETEKLTKAYNDFFQITDRSAFYGLEANDYSALFPTPDAGGGSAPLTGGGGGGDFGGSSGGNAPMASAYASAGASVSIGARRGLPRAGGESRALYGPASGAYSRPWSFGQFERPYTFGGYGIRAGSAANPVHVINVGGSVSMSAAESAVGVA